MKAEEYAARIAKIQSYNISLWGSFIFGFDGDTWRDCMTSVRFAQKTQLCMSCYNILTPYPGTALFDEYEKQGRLLTRQWDRYNGATVVYQPKGMTIDQLRHAQMAAFREFFSPWSSLRRLKLWPFKRNSWIVNVAINRGLAYYYHKRGRPLPQFADFLAADANARIAASLGKRSAVRCSW